MNRYLSAVDSIPATTMGAEQRAKDGYYSSYQLTSHRYREEASECAAGEMSDDKITDELV